MPMATKDTSISDNQIVHRAIWLACVDLMATGIPSVYGAGRGLVAH